MLWSSDYKTFLEEGDPSIGTPIWQGGDWFPTTHVRLYFDFFKFQGISATDLGNFFYEFANYNLVLRDIAQVFNTIFFSTTDSVDTADIVALGAIIQQDYYIPTGP